MFHRGERFSEGPSSQGGIAAHRVEVELILLVCLLQEKFCSYWRKVCYKDGERPKKKKTPMVKHRPVLNIVPGWIQLKHKTLLCIPMVWNRFVSLTSVGVQPITSMLENWPVKFPMMKVKCFFNSGRH